MPVWVQVAVRFEWSLWVNCRVSPELPTSTPMTAPRTATAATLSSLLMAAVLNIEAMTDRVALQPETPSQQLALSVLRPTQAMADGLGLTQPRRWLRSAIGRGEQVQVASDGMSADLLVPPGETDTAAPLELEETPPEPEVSEPEVLEPEVSAPPQPLQVWVIGDSLINMGGPRIATLLEEGLQANVHVDSRPNTGLVRLDYYDWPAALEARLQTGPAPHIVVVLMGANDSQNMRIDGKRTERWSPEWQAEYARRAGAIMDRLGDSGARVAWLGLPGMRRRSHQTTADLLNGLLEGEAGVREHVAYIPLEERFTYRGRRFSVHLEHADGQRFTARAGDGVHFTWSGSRVLADHVLGVMAQSWPDWMVPEEEPAVAAGP